MPKYIQVDSGVNLDNKQLHINKIDIASSISTLINNNLINPSVSLVYDSTNLKTKQHTEFDDFPVHSKIMSKLINKIIEFEDKFQDQHDYIILLLKFIKSEIIESAYDSDIVKEMFFNLSLEGFYDNISATFFKDKLNTYFSQSEA